MSDPLVLNAAILALLDNPEDSEAAHDIIVFGSKLPPEKRVVLDMINRTTTDRKITVILRSKGTSPFEKIVLPKKRGLHSDVITRESVISKSG